MCAPAQIRTTHNRKQLEAFLSEPLQIQKDKTS